MGGAGLTVAPAAGCTAHRAANTTAPIPMSTLPKVCSSSAIRLSCSASNLASRAD